MSVAGKKLWILLFVTVIGIVLLNFSFINSNSLNFAVENLSKIEIKNGNTGKVIVLEEDDGNRLLEELIKLNVKLDGINIWACGYKYKVNVFTPHGNKEIVIKSKNEFTKGIFKYKTEKDIVNLLESFIIE